MKFTSTPTSDRAPQSGSWRKTIAQYQNPALMRSGWQLGNTLVPYFVLSGIMVWSLQYSYWLTLALAVPTGGFMVRMFIIFHDCTHGSFFKSQKANNFIGNLTGVLTYTPFAAWQHDHSIHHATSGDLDRRGYGDIWTMTVTEYLQASRGRQFLYRLARHPIVLFGIAPVFLFFVHQRYTVKKISARAKASIFWTNLALAAILVLAYFTIGLKAFFLVQVPTVALAASAGVWLFYVQHQFEGVYWERREHWDFETQAIDGSSFYKLPKVLQWFTGSIGFHHIHHLSPAIPNYYLERCHAQDAKFQRVRTLSFFSSLKSLSFRLWDEERRQLISFSALKNLQKN